MAGNVAGDRKPMLSGSRLSALTAAALVSVIAAGGRTRDLPLPGPAPRAPIEPVDGIGLPTDDGCARCHAEIAEEWRTSLHHRAFRNDYFSRAYAAEPTPFCRKCHAPSADPAVEPPPEARALGVGCTACHVVPAGVVGARAVPLREGGHAVIGDARMAAPAACGGCHDFPFPAPRGVAAGPMQDTLGEHARSPFAGTACQGCHMPAVPSRGGGTHRSHAFRVQGDRAMLARAVDVRQAALSGGEVRLVIAPGTIGHAFPTGDLFRRAEVRAAPVDAAGRVIGPTSIAVLGRAFGVARAGAEAYHVQRDDTRLAGPRALALRMPPGTRRARYQIVWQRLPPALAARLGMVMSDHEQVVIEGVVTR